MHRDEKDKAAVIEENRKLVRRYPFLLPRNRWNDEPTPDYDYSYTELDDMPAGWRKAFGKELLDDLKDELLQHDFLHEFRILQIKEKFGALRFYTGHIPVESRIPDVIDKYEHISARTCVCCGRIGVPILDDGWVSPYCRPCYRKIQVRRVAYGAEARGEQKTEIDESRYNMYIVDNDEPDTKFTVRVFSPGGKGERVRTLDVSEILQRMQRRNPDLFDWPGRHIHEWYQTVFDSKGLHRLCGRSYCVALMNALSDEFPGVSFGNTETGFTDDMVIKEYMGYLDAPIGRGRKEAP